MSEPDLDISVVLPAHNEAGNIARMASTLEAILKPLGRYEIIFVDDGSADGTLAAIRAAAATNPQIRYLSFTRNFGHQEALRAGLRQARGDAVIVMDADFEHPPELIPQLFAAWRDGAKVVATRREDGEADLPPLKSLTSRLYYRLLDAIGDVRIEPGSADYMLLDRDVIDTINSFADQDVFLRGTVRWFGYPTTTITFSRGARTYGESKYTLKRMVDLAVTGIAAHSVRPLRLAIWLALGVRRGRIPAADLFGGQLSAGAADRDRLDLDHGDDRVARRRAIAGARHYRRICRPYVARGAWPPDLHHRRDRCGPERAQQRSDRISPACGVTCARDAIRVAPRAKHALHVQRSAGFIAS